MKIRVLTYDEIDRAEWSALVRESETGTWFQSPEAYEFFASMPELFKPFVVAVKSEELRAVCVGYVTVEKSSLKQFVTRRAIINGGPVIANDATEADVIALLEAVKTKNNKNIFFRYAPIYIETRNFNDYSRWKGAFEKAGFAYKKHLNFHIDCTNREAMWKRLSETRKRQIRKQPTQTLPEGKAYTDVTEAEIREWYAILKQLYRTKVKTPLWPVEFFLEAYRQGIARYLLVKHEGRVIGGIMLVCKGLPMTGEGIRDEKSCVYEWFICGMDAEYKEQYPSVMATWAAMDYAEKHGIARFDVMGAGEPDVPYGVRDFKAEFGGKLVEHGRFLCVCKPWLYQLGTIGVKIIKGK